MRLTVNLHSEGFYLKFFNTYEPTPVVEFGTKGREMKSNLTKIPERPVLLPRDANGPDECSVDRDSENPECTVDKCAKHADCLKDLARDPARPSRAICKAVSACDFSSRRP